ncbi:MAG: type II and III secretion system protein [Phycisphaeraceae bacterium]|nr:type II and III secretion system protein [Phycisphaeraceae bacterium]
MRIRNSVLVLALSLGLPAATLISEPAYGQAAQPTAEELYNSGMELYKAGELKEAQTVLRKVDPLQLPRDKQPSFYNALFEIDQKLNAPEPDTTEPEVAEPETAEPEVTEPETAEPQVTEPAGPDAASLLRQADALAENNPAEALSVYQQVLADEDATTAQKATAQARIAGIERQLNGDITGARKLIALAEQDIVNDDLNAAESKLNSVKNSGIELGFFDSESVNKKLALISEVRNARAAAAEADRLAALEAEQNQPEPKTTEPKPAPDAAAIAAAEKRAAEAEAVAAKAAADKAEAEAKLAAMQRKLEEDQVSKGAPVSDLMVKARANTAADKAEQGDKALRTGQLNAAVQLYEDATLLDPDNKGYQAKLADAKAKLNEQMRPLGVLDKTTNDRIVDRKAAIAEYEKAITKATADLEKQDFLAANNSVIEARTILSRDRQVFETQDYNDRVNRANQLQSLIQTTQARADAEQKIRIEREREEIERQVAKDTQRRKIEEIQNHLRKARALQLEKKYDGALVELDAALFLEPNNPVIRSLRDMIQDTAYAFESFELKRDRDLAIAGQSLLNIESTTPFADILTYPGDWPELTAIRLRGLDNDAGESEANRAAQASLRKIVTLSNDNLSLDQVIAFIRDTTGANIAVNWPALELVGIDQDSLVTISLSRVPAEQLLRLVLDQVSADAFDDDKAGFTVTEGIVKISTLRDLKSETETRVYDIRDLLVQVPNFDNAPGFDLNEALSNTSSGGSGGGGSGGGGGGGEGGLFGDSDDSDQDEDLPSRQELVDQIVNLINTTVGDPDEWLDEESTLTELNGNMIIKTTGDNHRQIVGLLGRLRETRAVQISVEARFLAVDKNFLDEFRFDFDISFNNDNVDADADGVPDNGASTPPIVIGNDSVGLAGRPSTSVGNRFTEATDAVTGAPINAFNLGYSFINDIQVDLLLNATQANERSIGLTAPRVTFFNGQRAYTMVATQTAFVSDLEPIPDSIGFDPTISVVTTGVVLDVEGTISSDRRYVTMTLRPSLANLVSLTEFEIGGGGLVDTDGDGILDTFVGGGNVQIPEIQITQVRNTVSIPDRGTLLVGGQRLVGEIETEVGVPVLSKIPVVNRLFTQSSSVQDESTLLILVRPTIIIQSEQEEVLFPGLNDDPEGYNVGNFNP